jgi:hypothetical protein
MTYPPQQPGGYGGYGQQPDPYGQSQPGGGQPQQQPGYPGAQQPHGGQPYQQQPGAWGQPGGGFPPSGPQQQPAYPPPFGQGPSQQGETQQFGQPGQPGATQQFGGPESNLPGGFGDQYGQPGGYHQWANYGEEPPKKKKTGLIIGIAVGVVVVVGAAIGLVIGLSGGDKATTNTAAPPAQPAPTSSRIGGVPAQPSTSAPNPSTGSTDSTGSADEPAPGGKQSAQELFEAAAADFSSGDGQGLATLACRSVYDGGAVQIDTTQIELTGAAQETGATASVRYKATKGAKTANGTMTSKREAGVWCLLDAQADKQ